MTTCYSGKTNDDVQSSPLLKVNNDKIFCLEKCFLVSLSISQAGERKKIVKSNHFEFLTDAMNKYSQKYVSN